MILCDSSVLDKSGYFYGLKALSRGFFVASFSRERLCGRKSKEIGCKAGRACGCVLMLGGKSKKGFKVG